MMEKGSLGIWRGRAGWSSSLPAPRRAPARKTDSEGEGGEAGREASA